MTARVIPLQAHRLVRLLTPLVGGKLSAQLLASCVLRDADNLARFQRLTRAGIDPKVASAVLRQSWFTSADRADACANTSCKRLLGKRQRSCMVHGYIYCGESCLKAHARPKTITKGNAQ